MQSPGLVRVATYERRVSASLERVWENVRDWEHLPWLHAGSFRSIALEEEGAWGWRARIGLHPSAEIRLELVIDADRPRYVSRTVEGPGARSEIWTTLAPISDAATDIAVEFWLADVAPASADRIGAVYTRLYTQLWDEDESMMMRRTEELARKDRDATPMQPLQLGSFDDLRARLPFCFEFAGERWRLVDLDGVLVAHATRCPHRFGPLEDAAVIGGAITCPWHGWRFDVASGRGDRGARLPRAPRVVVSDDGVVEVSGS